MNPNDIEWLKSMFEEKGLFSNLTPQEIGSLIDHMDRMNFAPGDTLVQEGDPGDWFFIVQKGKVKTNQKKWLIGNKEIATLGSKDFFGEIALLSSGKRSATLTAVENTVCFSMYKSQFAELVEKCPNFREEMERLVAQRAGN